jgi:transposase
VFVIQDQEGRVIGEGSVPTTREGFRKFRDDQGLAPGTVVGLETGTTAFFAATCLADLDLRPQVIDAGEVRLKASRPLQKSDRRDAFELCDGIRRGIYRTVVRVPPPPIRELREALSRRRHFVRLKTAQVNAVKRLLRGYGEGSRTRSLQAPSSWERLLESLAGFPRLQSHVRRHRAVWLMARDQVRELEEEIEVLTEPWKDHLERLQSVPGVGPIVAATTVAVLFEADRFPSAKHVASYAGLIPSTHQSGDHEHHGRITRRGSRELRAMLCEAAHHAARPHHPLNPYFAQICARKGRPVAVVAVAHRLARILFALLRDGTSFDPHQAGVELGPFTKVSVRRYRRIA